MSLVWRKIQRSNKKAAKYRFTIIPQELLIIGTNKWTPENVLVACLHRFVHLIFLEEDNCCGKYS